MQSYTEDFIRVVGARPSPSSHEKRLYTRAQHYIAKLRDIPGIRMIAICNSLSMYATHPGSDIDLFIVTEPDMLWFVRFFVTLKFFEQGVWRHGEDIAENFCLSFFVTTDALDLEEIAIRDDIYLYHWIKHLKPILDRNGTYERFLHANSWVTVTESQKKENLHWCIEDHTTPARSHLRSPSRWQKALNSLIRWWLEPKTLRKYESLGRPPGVIISPDMLKFHDQDQRATIRDTILAKNFDK